MKLSSIDKKIIDAIIQKSNKICPGSLALIGVYGSVCTDDTHEKSDLDLMILINDDAGWQLSDGFILDDKQIGYDIYCTNWQMLEEDANCNHAHLAKLMDSEIVYTADQKAFQKLEELRLKAAEVLTSDIRFARVDEIVNHAKKVYADAMITETIAEIRVCAFCCIYLLLDVVMIENGQYFHKGVKRTFEELEGLSLPKHFVHLIYNVVEATEITELKHNLTKLLQSAVLFTKRDRNKEQPTTATISGTYEEMFSNWRNKMLEAAERKDVFSSFMNLASLQWMIDELAEDVMIDYFNVMDQYAPLDLEHNAEVFDRALLNFLQEYKKIGIQPKHFDDVEAFMACYLQPPCPNEAHCNK